MAQRITLLSGTLLLLLSCGARNGLAWPLPHAQMRPTPLHFGLYVTPDPAQNPIDPPERFTGYHAGTDFEIFEDEQDSDVPVFAICDGDIAFSGYAEGYGGLVRQYCTIRGEPVTVLYGHLAVDSLIEEGVSASSGQILGILGAARSRDTDGSRKHLHLGILKGHVASVRGYVEEAAELTDYIDPQSIL